MKNILLLVAILAPQYSHAEDDLDLWVSCEREYLTVEIDDAKKSIDIISNRGLDGFISRKSDLKIDIEDVKISKGGLFIGQEEMFSYYLGYPVKSNYKITYPNDKVINIKYTDLEMTKENLTELRLKSKENAKFYLDDIKEATKENPCPIELRYYIKYN
tara:strand:+ start:2058 stop:2534 length:477 start_codon:yes stop_codon:yes gene_type:complete